MTAPPSDAECDAALIEYAGDRGPIIAALESWEAARFGYRAALAAHAQEQAHRIGFIMGEPHVIRPPAPPDDLVRVLASLHGEHGSGLIERLGGARRMLVADKPQSSWVTAEIDDEAARALAVMRDAIEARDRRIAELSETANNEQRARLQADVAYMQAEARAEAMRKVIAADEAILEAIPQRFFGQPGIARLVSNANAARAALKDAKP